MPRPADGYKLKDGTPVPGVTSITNRFLERSALMQWAFRQGKAGMPSLYAKRDQAADVGTACMAMIERDIKGERRADIWAYAKDTLRDPVQLERAVKAFHAYEAWKKQFSVRVTEMEVSLVSEVHKYGGTPDLVGVVGNQLGILDFKTGNGTAVYVDHLLQLAGYGQLWAENRPDVPLTGGFHLVRLDRETGKFSHRWFPDLTVALRQFLLLRQCFDLDLALAEPKMLAGACFMPKPRVRLPYRRSA